jgi:CHAT domain-containing protein
VQIASLRPFRGERSSCATFQDLEFEPLEASRREAREVVRIWAGATKGEEGVGAELLSGAGASEGAFKRRAPSRRVVHLATHGFFLGGGCPSALEGARGVKLTTPGRETGPPPLVGENPLLLSGLALAGANHREAAGSGEEDGILTAEEIASLDLVGVDWAVLSACGTALGKIEDGEGVFGLRRAFEVAGARTVIMSLWEVRDRATREWMRELYRARLEGGMGTAEAVRQASLQVLERRHRRGQSTHPFHWGAFVAVGDWR